jgi:hypothetical protein
MVGDEGMFDEDRHPQTCWHEFNPIRFNIDRQDEEDERPFSKGPFLLGIPFIPFICVEMKRQRTGTPSSLAVNRSCE